MLIGAAAGIIEKLADEFKTAGPEEKEHFLKSSVALLEILTESLKSKIGTSK